jgi:hypothetical protein
MVRELFDVLAVKIDDESVYERVLRLHDVAVSLEGASHQPTAARLQCQDHMMSAAVAPH